MPGEAEAKAASTTDFLDAIEDFFCSPSFTSALGTFLSEHGEQLEFVPPEETQPMKNYDIFMKYQALVEEQLTQFLTERGINSQDVFKACQEAQASGEAASRTCIDYLLASTEYESFMQLAADHVNLANYQVDPGAEDDYELPPADEEGEEGARVVPLDAEEEVAVEGANT